MSDITFACIHCGGQLVVDQDGAGLQIDCPRCQKTITIPSCTCVVSPMVVMPEIEQVSVSPSSERDQLPRKKAVIFNHWRMVAVAGIVIAIAIVGVVFTCTCYCIGREKMFEAALDRAQQAKLTGNIDGIITAYSEAVKIKPGNADAWCQLGAAYTVSSRRESAVSALRKATELKPDDAENWSTLGLAYQQFSMGDESIEAFRHAVKIKPDYADAWVCLGIAYSRNRQSDRAIEAYKKALEIKPDHEEAKRQLALELYVSADSRTYNNTTGGSGLRP